MEKLKCPTCGGTPGFYPKNECPVCWVKRQATQPESPESEELEQRIVAILCDYIWPTSEILAKLEALITRQSAKHTIAVLEGLKQPINYNKHDMGEMGQFIRTEYVYNILDAAIATEKQGEGK